MTLRKELRETLTGKDWPVLTENGLVVYGTIKSSAVFELEEAILSAFKEALGRAIPENRATYKVKLPPFVVPDETESGWNSAISTMKENVGRMFR